MVHGVLGGGRFEWNLAASNGDGESLTNNENSPRWTGRVVWNPFGEFGYSEGDFESAEKGFLASLGANFTFVSEHLNSAGALSDKDLGTAGVEAAIKVAGLYVVGELFSRTTNPEAPVDDFEDLGFYAQAGYFVVPKTVEIGVRFSQISFDEATAGLNGAGADVEDVREVSAVAGWYFDKHSLKIQGDVTQRMTDAFTGPDLDDTIVRLQASVVL
jgi:hypothetical protein